MVLRRLSQEEIEQRTQEQLPEKLAQKLVAHNQKLRFFLVMVALNTVLVSTSILLVDVLWHTILTLGLLTASMVGYIHQSYKTFQVEKQINTLDVVARYHTQQHPDADTAERGTAESASR